MSAVSYSRGHKIVFNGIGWVYCDNKKPLKNDRRCIKCGKKPTSEGHDACIGTINNAKSVCCGHGVAEAIIK